ncbi:MAG: hypothetical protein NW241_08320 [Bacteroidia bacterium]|nr:hypothetical protein [Bacteroidia bacterium]
MWFFPLLRWLYMRPARFRHLSGLAALALFLIAWAGMLPRLEALRLPDAWRMYAQTSSAALLALWFAGASWYYTLFRWAWYLPAALLGRSYRWLISGWRVWLLAAAGVGAAAWGFYRWVFGVRITVQDLFRAPEDKSMPQLWLVILVLAGLYLLLRSVFRDRRRIRVDSVESFGVPTEHLQGLSSSLSHELLALKALYSSARRLSLSVSLEGVASGSATPRLDVGQVGLTLDTVVSGNPEIKLGAVSIPLKPLIQAMEKLYTGPVLDCKLYNESATWRLDASLTGGNAQQWQIRHAAPASGMPVQPVLNAMIQELATRIFTHLEGSRLGSYNWKAIRAYTEGIRAYRDAVRYKSQHAGLMSRAETEFVNALREDAQFSRCYYNLGVVYFHEANYQPAAIAFSRSAATGDARPDVFYALAKSLQPSNPEAALRACRQVLDISPFEILAWNLLGVIEANSFQRYEQSLPAFATAAALGWRRLCFEQFTGKLAEEDRSTVTVFLCNLGATLCYTSRSTGLSQLRQAIRLRPQDTGLRYEYIKSLVLHQRMRPAATHMKCLIQLQPHNHSYRFWLLALTELAGGNIDNPPLIHTAFDCGYEDQALRKGVTDWQNYTRQAKIQLPESFRAMAVYESLQPAAPAAYTGQLSVPLIAVNPQSISGLKEPDLGYVLWRKQIQHAAEEAYDLINAEMFPQAYDRFYAIAEDPQVNRLLPGWLADTGLYGTLVWICTSQLQRLRQSGESQEQLAQWQAKAVQAAQAAFSRQPIRAWERSILGLLFSDFQNWEHARNELSIGLGLDPKNVQIVQDLLGTIWAQVARSTNLLYRNQAITELCDRLLRQIDLIRTWKHRKLSEADWKNEIALWGWTHFWLGRFSVERQDYETGVTHLLIAVQEGFRPNEANMALCYAQNKTGAYEGAEQSYTNLEKLISPATLSSAPPADGGLPPMIAWAYAALYMAHGYALRHARLDQARRMAADAFDRAEAWAEQQQDAEVSSHIPLLAAQSELVLGLICRAEALHQTPGTEALPAKLHESLEHLRKAAGYDCYPATMAEIFYCTGLNTWELGKLESDPARKGYWERRTREAWGQARRLDVRGEYTPMIDEKLSS